MGNKEKKKMQEFDNKQFEHINKNKIGLKELQKSKYQKILDCKSRKKKTKK